MATENKYQKRDDASSRLGEKLLQGWTMLAAHCPSDDCFTPLMRNREGKMFCVSCDQYVISEEEAKKQQEEKEAREQEEREQLIAARFAQEQLERQQAQRDRDLQLQFEREQKAKQLEPTSRPSHSTAPANGPVKRKSEDAALSTTADEDFLAACRRQTLAALYQKLEELTASISTSDHSERVLATTKAINELTLAIKNLTSTTS